MDWLVCGHHSAAGAIWYFKALRLLSTKINISQILFKAKNLTFITTFLSFYACFFLILWRGWAGLFQVYNISQDYLTYLPPQFFHPLAPNLVCIYLCSMYMYYTMFQNRLLLKDELKKTNFSPCTHMHQTVLLAWNFYIVQCITFILIIFLRKWLRSRWANRLYDFKY